MYVCVFVCVCVCVTLSALVKVMGGGYPNKVN